MDWTFEDNMVDGLFLCATLTGRRGAHIPLVQASADTSDTCAEAGNRTHAVLGRVIQGGWWMKVRSLVVLSWITQRPYALDKGVVLM